MKGTFTLPILVTTLGFFAPRHAFAQDALYVSNLGESTAATAAALGGNWLAAEFTTGTNSSGYTLNSIDLLFSDATDDPGSGFVLMVYTNSGGKPGSSIGTLSGSSNPDVAGTYAYPASGVTLSFSTPYWVVARQTPLTGGYLWDYTTSTNYTFSDGWSMNTARYDNSDAHGSDWISNNGDALQFEVDATPVPEPQAVALLGLGLSALFFRTGKF